MRLIKQLIILLISLFLSLVFFFLVVLVPAIVQMQLGNSNPPPPFDVGPKGLYFSHPEIQLLQTIMLLLTPLFGSFIAYLLNSMKKNPTVYLPTIIGYLLYLGYLIYYYSHLSF